LTIEKKYSAKKIIIVKPDIPCNGSSINEGGRIKKGYLKKGADSEPLVTIITIVFNGRAFLEEAILSVINQTYKNIEYIVIDGGSTDGTVDIIRKYDQESKIDYWISECDAGIADAWNKGLAVASGKYIGLLNSDDYYDSFTIANAVDAFAHHNEQDVILYGKTIFLDKTNNIVSVNNKKFDERNLIKGFGFMHTTCFCSKALYEKIGVFDKKYRIAVDTDFLFRCYKKDVVFIKSNLITYMRNGGLSDQNKLKAYKEYLQIIKADNSFSKCDLLLAEGRSYIVCGLRYFFDEEYLKKIRLQLIFFGVALFNLFFNMIPFFMLKKILLRICGVKIGTRSYVHTKVKFFNFGSLIIGDNSTINSGCYLDNRNQIVIGNNVSIAHNCKIYTLGHDVDDPLFSHVGGAVVIEDYACIFSNVLIMPNVRIGKGAVVFPGSVVTRNVGEFEVVGGNPAKIIRQRNEKMNYTIDYGYWFAL
jgi:acetyltransferase-like isoleucine patch superfamily enzyme